MLALEELQRAFRHALLNSVTDRLAGAIRTEELDPAARFSLYHNNVFGNLATVLCLTYPAIARLVGADLFAAAVARFLADSPSDHASLYEWGKGFPAFLECLAPAPLCFGEVARLEWAISYALHAPEEVKVDLARFAASARERRGRITFRPCAGISLLVFDCPAYAIWQAVMAADKAAMAAIDFDAEPERLIVHRTGSSAGVLELTGCGMTFARLLCEGHSFDEALAAAGEENVTFLFSELLARGCFAEVIEEPAPLPPEEIGP